MPIHDWTRVEAGIFHAFHHDWVTELARALNRGVQWRPTPAVAGIRVCTVVEQKRGEIEMEIDDGFKQRRSAVGIAEVHVGFRIHQ